MKRQLGDFTLLEKVGSGGMGDVYRARQVSLDREVAVKVLPRSLAKETDFIQRFQREAKSAASLIHPNVIQIYSIGIEEGIPYFAMEYVEGEDLQKRMRRVDRFSYEEIVSIIMGVTQALAMAHERGIVHRDIKPSNIMFDKANTIKVMDFGLAKVTSGGGDGANLTQTGLIMGTPNYISPEQGQGLPLDTRSDVYSLGIVFYELLTGQRPFRADTPASLIYKHAFEAPDPPTRVKADVPPFLEEICLRMIAKDPNERYSTPNDLLEDLNEFNRHVDYYLAGGLRREGGGAKLNETGGVTERTMAVPTPSGEITAEHTMTSVPMGAGRMVAVVVGLLLVLGAGAGVAYFALTPPSKEGGLTKLALSELRGHVPQDMTVFLETESGWQEIKDFQDLEVSPGKFRLRFEKPHHVPLLQPVTLEADGTLNPAWAAIRLDGLRPRAVLPLSELRLEPGVEVLVKGPGDTEFMAMTGLRPAVDPGTYQLKLAKPYHDAYTVTVEVEPTTTTPALATIRPQLKEQPWEIWRVPIPLRKITAAISERWSSDLTFVVNGSRYGADEEVVYVHPDEDVNVTIEKPGYRSATLISRARLSRENAEQALLERARDVEFQPATEMANAMRDANESLADKDLNDAIKYLRTVAQLDAQYENAGQLLKRYENEKERLDKLVGQARSLQEAFKVDEAEAILSEITKAKWRDYDDDVQSLDQLIAMKRAAIKGEVGQVRSMLERGEFDEARIMGNFLLRNKPDNEELKTIITSSDTAERMYAEANRDMDEGHYGDAVRKYDEVIGICPNFVEAKLRRDDAKTLETETEELQVQLQNARQKLAAQDYDGAMLLVQEMLGQHPRNQAVLALKETILRKQEEALVLKAFTELDQHFMAGQKFEAIDLMDSQSGLKNKMREDISTFFDHKLRFEKSEHKDFAVTLDEGGSVAKVACRWEFILRFPGVPEDMARMRASLKQLVSLRKDAGKWVFTSFEEEGDLFIEELSESPEVPGAGGSGND